MINLKCTFAVTAGLCSSLAYAQNQPHIILIMTDQQRGDAMGCMGNESVISPSGRFGKRRNVVYERIFFVSQQYPCPCRTVDRTVSLASWLVRIWQSCPQVQPRNASDAERCWILYLRYRKMHWHPQRIKHGFEGTLLDESGRREDPNFISDYRLWFQIQAPGKNPDETGIGWNDHGAATYKLKESLHPTYWTGEMACQMIQNYDNGNQPLFLKVSFARPHSPYDPPQRFLDMYKDAQVPDPVIGDWCGKYAKELDPEKAAKDAPYGNFGNEYARHSKRYYYANITFIDEQIGRVLQTLKDKGMYDNSLIIFVSDHGDMMGDHYHWRKTYPYEGSTHIPYIIKWPAKAQVVPGKVDNPVELRDLLPTFLEIAGTSVPTDIDGRSLLSLAKGTETEWRKYIDLEHATCYSDDNYWCALTDGKIKYIWYFYTGEEQLFDLAKDPKELHNAVSDKKYKSCWQACVQK